MTRKNFTVKTKGLIRERSGVTPEIVCELLSYDPESGHLFWKIRAAHWFSTAHQCNAWNTKNANKREIGRAHV
jgi:hypothetical protein